jgi:hypothetical protein
LIRAGFCTSGQGTRRIRARRWPGVRCGADRRDRSPRSPGSTSAGHARVYGQLCGPLACADTARTACGPPVDSRAVLVLPGAACDEPVGSQCRWQQRTVQSASQSGLGRVTWRCSTGISCRSVMIFASLNACPWPGSASRPDTTIRWSRRGAMNRDLDACAWPGKPRSRILERCRASSRSWLWVRTWATRCPIGRSRLPDDRRRR